MIANNGRRVNGKAGKIEIMLQNAHKRPLDESGPQAVKKTTESSRGPKLSRFLIVPGGVYGGCGAIFAAENPIFQSKNRYLADFAAGV